MQSRFRIVIYIMSALLAVCFIGAAVAYIRELTLINNCTAVAEGFCDRVYVDISLSGLSSHYVSMAEYNVNGIKYQARLYTSKKPETGRVTVHYDPELHNVAYAGDCPEPIVRNLWLGASVLVCAAFMVLIMRELNRSDEEEKQNEEQNSETQERHVIENIDELDDFYGENFPKEPKGHL